MQDSEALRPPLVQAALSHLELALANVGEQVRLFQDDEQQALRRAAEHLRQLATRSHEKPQATFEADARSKLDPRHASPQSSQKLAVERSQALSAAESNQKDTAHEVRIHVEEQRGLEAMPAAQSEAEVAQLPSSAPSKPGLRGQFMEIFDELDQDKEGSIDLPELRDAFQHMGLPPALATSIFRRYDETGDGKIDRVEWLRIIEDFEKDVNDDVLKEFLQALSDRHARDGHVYYRNTPSCCILRHDSRERVLWDMFMVILLLYVALTLPLALAFGEEGVPFIPVIDWIVDGFFMLDVLVNFRTTFVNKNMDVVQQSRPIACHYFKTWFFLDFISSVPLEELSAGLMPRLQSIKLLKFGKIAKVCKMLRISKLLKLIQGSELMEHLEELVWSTHCYTISRLLKLMAQLVVCGHWLACLLIALEGPGGNGAVDQYFDNSRASTFGRYLAALYWSMMTITTVGYGDVGMTSDGERFFAIISMIFGSSFYGYVIGSIAALVSQHDLNQRAFKARMDLVMSWLNFHDELPQTLRRRIWRHFKEHLSKKTAVEDSIVMNDLSPVLKRDVAHFLMHDDVRYNPLFEGLPTSELTQLALMLEQASVMQNDHVCTEGDRGVAMWIILKGVASLEAPEREATTLSAGDSFGEDILLGMSPSYAYTVIADSKLEMLRLSLSTFEDRFRSRPDLVTRMKQNFMKRGAKIPRPNIDHNRASVINGGGACLPPSFADAVFDAFHDITKQLESLNSFKHHMDSMAERLVQRETDSQALHSLHAALVGDRLVVGDRHHHHVPRKLGPPDSGGPVRSHHAPRGREVREPRGSDNILPSQAREPKDAWRIDINGHSCFEL